MSNTTEGPNQCPWLGLAPYKETDADLFYGRSAEIRELVAAIIDFPQTVIFGPSGTGKTSILSAGVFPRLKEKYFLPVYVRFDHSEGVPGYEEQLLTLLKAELEAGHTEVVGPKAALPETLWEFLHRNEFWSAQNQPVRPVFVIDQFEEIFTVTSQKEKVADFVIQLGDLCNNTIPETLNRRLVETRERLNYPVESQNYRLVISLREDFLARLEELAVAIPVLKRNRYSLQALNGEEAMEVVLGPGKGLVEEPVARLIIKKAADTDNHKIGGDLKSLQVEPALLSLLCSELNNQRIKQGLDHIPAELVEASGSHIIRNFYEETMRSVSPATAAYIEDNLLTASGYRNSVAMDDVLSRGIPEKEIALLVSKRLLRFEELMGIKRVEFSHDILTAIAKEKRENRRYEQKLASDTAQLERQRKRLRRYIWASAVLLILLVGVVLTGYFLFFHRYEFKYAHIVKRWGFFEGLDRVSDEQAAHMGVYYKLSKKGWYTFSLKKKHFDKLYSMDGNGHLTTDNGMGTYLYENDEDSDVDSAIQAKFGSVCQWSTVSNEDGKPVYEMGFDKDTAMIWGFIYSPTTEVTAAVVAAWSASTGSDAASKRGRDTTHRAGNSLSRSAVVGHFVDNTGLLMNIRKGGANFVKITYDQYGFDSLRRYFDEFGAPAPGPSGAYASLSLYNKKGLLVGIASLDQCGDYMIDSSGNTGMEIFYDENDNQDSAVSFGKNHEKKALKDGYTTVRNAYDRYGNTTEYSYYDSTGTNPVLTRAGVHVVRKTYDDRGHEILIENLDIHRKPVVYSEEHPYLVPIKQLEYDRDGHLTEASYYEWKDGRRSPVRNAGLEFHKFVARYNKAGKPLERFWYGPDLKLMKGEYSGVRTWYDADGNDTMTIYYNADSLPSENYDIIRRKYINRALVSQLRYDRRMRPTTDTSGIHGWMLKRDAINLTDTITYVDTLYRPVKGVNYAFEVKRYTDNSFEKIREEFFLDENKCYVSPDRDGARKVLSYDYSGDPSDMWFFGVGSTKGYDGYYKHLKYAYDLHHQLVGFKTLKENDELSYYKSNRYVEKLCSMVIS
jgi:hypothetical protein